ncbi:MAG: DUF1599 domain-containing protein [Bacteroidetes bacterium]|nr:DUF1599 domain-containing protein [Bacteroidota bacterium]MBM3424486.1 DUF1599 domain-containing protein [Bacteroidota bacterium]
MSDTLNSFTNITSLCREIYLNKSKDYGTAWRILRPVGIADQLYIKANRIRTVQEHGTSLVGDGIEGEFMAIVNYCIIGLIQLHATADLSLELTPEEAQQLYDTYMDKAILLMVKKNHDYGEAWQSMQVESLTDLILMKIYRIKQIISNEGKTIASEGIDGSYYDMLNYAVFALMHLGVK